MSRQTKPLPECHSNKVTFSAVTRSFLATHCLCTPPSPRRSTQPHVQLNSCRSPKQRHAQLLSELDAYQKQERFGPHRVPAGRVLDMLNCSAAKMN